MIVIVGGGICGLSIGWYLARAGCDVTVLDQGAVGATWAAAGMLAPQVEAEPGEERLLPLMLASQAAWPAFARELEAAAGQSVGYRAEGTIVVALDRDDAERLRFQHALLRRLGLDVAAISGAEARRLEPRLARTVTAALLSPRDHQVDNRLVAAALRTAFVGAGGRLRERTAVRELIVEGGHVRGVRLGDSLGDEVLPADLAVLAAGAWSPGIPGLPPIARPPVRPVKGQMLCLQMPADDPLIERVVWAPGAYLVPRADGRLLIGATVEEQGFDTSLTAGGLYGLLRGAWDALPGIDTMPILETWAGLRPGSRDDAPILGATGVGGLILATGHYRNGILLAPITAATIAELILTGATDELIKPFSLARFAR